MAMTVYSLKQVMSRRLPGHLPEVIRDPDLRERLGHNALQTAQKYSLDRVMADWDRILETVFATGPRLSNK